MGGVVEVLLRVRVGHARGVTADDVEVGPGRHASLAVPLDLQDNTTHSQASLGSSIAGELSTMTSTRVGQE